MKKRFLCAFLAAAVLFGVLAMAPFSVKASSNMTVSQELVDMVKKFEGFAEKPYWDNSQWSVGYGTECNEGDYPDGITKEEAEAELLKFLNQFCNEVNTYLNKYGITVNQHQFDALVSLSYNCGGNWTRDQQGTLFNAVKNGAVGNELLYAFSLWSKSGVINTKGLIVRRLAEANLYLNGVYGTARPADYSYVLFDPNGGVVNYRVQGYDTNEDTPIRVVASETYSVVVNGVVTETYTFDGWYTAASGGEKVEVLDGSLVVGTTLYAHWKASDGTVVTPPEPEVETIDPVMITVTGTEVHIRQGAGTGYNIVDMAKQGNTYTVTALQTDKTGLRWGKIGEYRWICLDYTNYDSASSGGNNGGESSGGNGGETGGEENTTVTGTVNVSDHLNIRTGPGTSYPIAVVNGQSQYYTGGTKVTILEQKSDGRTNWGRTDRGWICLDYVKLDPTGETVPPETTVPPTTVPPETTVPPTTVPPETTVPPTTVPPTTVPPTTVPPATVPPTTEPPETDPPVTEPTYTSWSGTVKVTDILYVRSGPGTYHTIKGFLANGEKVTILEEKTVDGMKWGRIDKGWISLKYVIVGAGSDEGTQNPTEPTEPTTKPTEPTVPPETTKPTEPPETQPTMPDIPVTTGKWTGKVRVESILYIRKEAGAAGQITGNLVNGTSVTVTQKKTVDGKVWGKIDKGWICLDYVIMDGETEPDPQPDNNQTGEGTSTVFDSPQVMTVNTCSLRIRSGAGVTNTILGYIPLGEEIEISEIKAIGSTVWAKTEAGWVSLKYLK